MVSWGVPLASRADSSCCSRSSWLRSSAIDVYKRQMIYGAAALTSVQHAITDIADKSAETDITCVIVNADDPGDGHPLLLSAGQQVRRMAGELLSLIHI